MTDLLTLRDVSRTFDGREVLRDLSLDVRAGDAIGIRGASGSGKSTLARIISGIDTEFDGTRILHTTSVHMMFQDSLQSFNPRIPLYWSLHEAWLAGRDALQLRLTGRDASELRLPFPAALARALHHVGLPAPLARRRPGQLSGGQRQRAALARALLSGAELLVLDEPVAALDPSVQARVLNVLTTLVAEERFAMIMISHDHAVLAHTCKDEYLLDGGSLWNTNSR